MLGIGRPDRHALPRITLVENCAEHEASSLPRERVRSSAQPRRSPAL
jgi:hypothetical protein